MSDEIVYVLDVDIAEDDPLPMGVVMLGDSLLTSEFGEAAHHTVSGKSSDFPETCPQSPGGHGRTQSLKMNRPIAIAGFRPRPTGAMPRTPFCFYSKKTMGGGAVAPRSFVRPKHFQALSGGTVMKWIGGEKVKVGAITVGGRLRAIDEGHAQQLVESIRQTGLQTPIVVRPVKSDEFGSYLLVSGAHRLRAAVILRWREIDAIIIDADDDEAGSPKSTRTWCGTT